MSDVPADTCLICYEPVPIAEILVHIRRMHPDDYAEPERWPDGRPVGIDMTDYTADEIGGLQ